MKSLFCMLLLIVGQAVQAEEIKPMYLFCNVGAICNDVELKPKCIKHSEDEPAECSLTGNLLLKGEGVELSWMTMGGNASLIITHDAGETTGFMTSLKSFVWKDGGYMSVTSSTREGKSVPVSCAVYESKEEFPACR